MLRYRLSADGEVSERQRLPSVIDPDGPRPDAIGPMDSLQAPAASCTSPSSDRAHRGRRRRRRRAQAHPDSRCAPTNCAFPGNGDHKLFVTEAETGVLEVVDADEGGATVHH